MSECRHLALTKDQQRGTRKASRNVPVAQDGAIYDGNGAILGMPSPFTRRELPPERRVLIVGRYWISVPRDSAVRAL